MVIACAQVLEVVQPARRIANNQIQVAVGIEVPRGHDGVPGQPDLRVRAEQFFRGFRVVAGRPGMDAEDMPRRRCQKISSVLRSPSRSAATTTVRSSGSSRGA